MSTYNDLRAAELAQAAEEAIDPNFRWNLDHPHSYPWKCDHSLEYCENMECRHDLCDAQHCHHVEVDSDGNVDPEKESRRALRGQHLRNDCISRMEEMLASLLKTGTTPILVVQIPDAEYYCQMSVLSWGTCNPLERKVFMNYLNTKALEFYNFLFDEVMQKQRRALKNDKERIGEQGKEMRKHMTHELGLAKIKFELFAVELSHHVLYLDTVRAQTSTTGD